MPSPFPESQTSSGCFPNWRLEMEQTFLWFQRLPNFFLKDPLMGLAEIAEVSKTASPELKQQRPDNLKLCHYFFLIFNIK